MDIEKFMSTLSGRREWVTVMVSSLLAAACLLIAISSGDSDWPVVTAFTVTLWNGGFATSKVFSGWQGVGKENRTDRRGRDNPVL